MRSTEASERVHLARVPLEGPEGTAARMLCESERERAGRFLVAGARRRFVLARAGLRTLLGEALGADPTALQFREARHGRPELAGAHDGALAFNLAHSGDLAVVAWRSGGLLGVDLELLRGLERMDELAEETLGAAELEDWRALPADSRANAFFASWTRKEAVLKATGVGLSGGLRGLDVRGPSPLAIQFEGHALVLLDLDVGPNFRAALAADTLRPAVGVAPAPALRTIWH